MWRPEVETAPRETLQEVQLRRLRALVRRLERQVPFYRQALQNRGVRAGDIKSLEDIRLLPQTTRSDLRSQYPLGLLAVRTDQVARFQATSGTGGKPTLVAHTAPDLRTGAEIGARALAAAGARRGEVWYVTSSYGLFSGGMGAHYALEHIGATVVPASSGNTSRLVQLLSDIPAAGIHCVPTYMLRLAEVASSLGVDPRSFGLRFGSYGGETWSEPLRRRIENLFGLTAYDIYGLAECFGPGVGYECEARHGLHLAEDHFIVELLDPLTGEPVPEGQEGEVTITTLTKLAMPLLRYRTGDLTRFLPGACPCGRTLKRIDRISGRSDGMLTIRGVNLYPSEAERVLLEFKEIAPLHRLVADRAESMDVLTLEAELEPPLQPGTAAADALARRLQKALRDQLSVGVVLSLLPPGTLPRSEGKAVRVVDRRPRP